MAQPYQPPVRDLLELPVPRFGRYNPWPEYLAMGFADEHVPELIRMATDAGLVEGDENETATHGGIHAWRTLGLLRAEAAVEALLELFDVDDDWVREEIPAVLGMIGSAAFEPAHRALARYSLDPDDPWKAAAASNTLVEIARRFPGMRDAAVATLSRRLRWWARHDPTLNTSLIDDLVELKAVEAAPLIEEVFANGAADLSIGDDWEDVQLELGLIAERTTPHPPRTPLARLHPTPDRRERTPRRDETRARRKAEKAARQRNRKRR